MYPTHQLNPLNKQEMERIQQEVKALVSDDMMAVSDELTLKSKTLIE